MTYSPDNCPIAIDFETYYDKDYSLSKMGTYTYVFDPRFKITALGWCTPYEKGIVNVYDEAELLRFIQQLDGRDVIAHNAFFDGLVVKKLNPKTTARFFCTADMCSYLYQVRSLKQSMMAVFHEEMSKEVRETAKGILFQKDTLLLSDLNDYCMNDAVSCMRLWVKCSDKWPEVEREQSRLNREAAWRGVTFDTEKCQEHIHRLKKELYDLELSIPWYGIAPTLSPKKIREQAALERIALPASLSKASAEMIDFMAGDNVPQWLRNLQLVRSYNTLIKRLESAMNLVHDGRLRYASKYYGCFPGRLSGGGAEGTTFNMYNMPRKPMYGCDLRALFLPAPGKILAVCDYSQIEARMLLYRAGDEEMCDRLRRWEHLYIATAKRLFGLDVTKGTPEYTMAKMLVLGCGYGTGPKQFQRILKTVGEDRSFEECEHDVYLFRDKNRKITKFWYDHGNALKLSIRHCDPTHEVELLSGRTLVYTQPRYTTENGQFESVARQGVLAPFSRIHHGTLTENEIQATSRDILRDAWLACDKKGLTPLFTVYDEMVFEVDRDNAREALAEIAETMVTSSRWLSSGVPQVEMRRNGDSIIALDSQAKGMPLGCEGELTEHYTK